MPIRGNEVVGLAVPVTRRARLTVERALVKRQYRGVQLGTLDELFLPTSVRTLHDKLLDGARQFVGDYAKQGFNALTHPEEFIVWGPYQCRGFGKVTTTPTVAHGSMMGEDPFPDDCDFILEGQFLATHGRIPT